MHQSGMSTNTLLRAWMSWQNNFAMLELHFANILAVILVFHDSVFDTIIHQQSAHFNCLILQVTKLCDLAADGDSVTSVSWSERV